MTKRYNIKPDVIALLKNISELQLVSEHYPSDWAKMPAAIYSTRAKPSKADVSKEERLTEWQIKTH